MEDLAETAFVILLNAKSRYGMAHYVKHIEEYNGHHF